MQGSGKCLKGWVDECKALIHQYMRAARNAPIETAKAEAQHKAEAVYEAMGLMSGLNCLEPEDTDYIKLALDEVNNVHQIKTQL